MQTTLFKSSAGFPQGLLRSSTDDREKFFKEHFAGHDHLLCAYRGMEASLFTSTVDGAVYRVFGPSGVGKSTIFGLLAKRCAERMESELAQESGRLAFLSCTVPKYERGFDWADFYRRLLVAGEEQMVDKRIALPDRDGHDPRRKTPVVENKRMAAMRQSFENLLKYRRPAAVLLDEAQHIGHVSGGRSLHDQHDILKSLAEETNIPFVLFGTYELIHFTSLSGQLARRGTRIHLQRYHGHVESEIKMFQRVVLDFQRHLPLEHEPDLLSHWVFLYEGSLGLIGVLKVWLQRALHRTLCPQNKEDTACQGTIDLGLLQRTMLDMAARKRLLQEAQEGEQLLAEEANEDELRTALWNPPITAYRAVRVSSVKKEKTAASSRRKPGERNPNRDVVGQPHVDAIQYAPATA